MTKVLDYAGKPPPPDAIKACGYSGVVRYLSPLPNSKVITAAEAHAEVAAGLAVGLVWEQGAQNSLGGALKGHQDGLLAAQMASDLGAPAGVCIYFAVDFDAQPSQLPTIAAYMDAARGQVQPYGYRQGVYGSASVCEVMLRDGHADLAWQTVAWSYGQHLAGPKVALYQRSGQVTVGGTACDVNDALITDWGQWPRPQEDDMFSDEDRKLLQAVKAWIDKMEAGVPAYGVEPLPASTSFTYRNSKRIAAKLGITDAE